jgi:hypothetical protein
MTASKDYPIDFIKRTQEILTDYYQDFQSKDREVTFLLNCLLGLIITIAESEKRKERIFKGNIDDSFLLLIPDKIGFIHSNKLAMEFTKENLTEVMEVTVMIGHKNDLKEKKKSWFLNKIRNSIAHQNIEAINNEDEKWIGVRLWNINYDNKKDFEIIFTIEELKKFAIELSKKYLL